MNIKQQTIGKTFQHWMLAFALLASAGGCAAEEQEQSSALLIEGIVRCNDIGCISFEGFSELKRTLIDDEKTGLARRVAVTTLNGDSQDNVLWEFRFARSIRLFDLHAVGVGNSFGSLPALAVAFDDPLASLKDVYEGFGFKFKCDTPPDLKGTACEAALNVEPTPSGSHPLEFTVFLTDSPRLLQVGKSLAACTVLPRVGNPFR